MKVEAISPAVDGLGESGHWDSRGKASSLIWVNTPGKEVKRFHVATQKITTVSTEESVSFCLPREKENTLLIAQGRRLDFISEVNGEQTNFVPSTSLNFPENVVTNDGKCDSRGRLWFGTYEKAPFDKIQPIASLYSVTGNGVVRQQATGFKLANGLDWTTDERTMFLADTLQKCIFAFDFDIETGQISRQRKALEFTDSDAGMPDGMTIDAEDKMWVAKLGRGAVVRYDVTTGKELQHVDLLPTTGVTCPTFGGSDYCDLYVTTTQMFLPPEGLKAQPQAGSLHRVTELGIKGKPSFKFAG